MIEIKLNFTAKQTDHIVCILQPSAATYLSSFKFFALSIEFHSIYVLAHCKAVLVYINCFKCGNWTKPVGGS